jgi:hypothetical protein
MNEFAKFLSTSTAVFLLISNTLFAQSSIGLRGGMTFGNFPNLPVNAPDNDATDASGMWGNYGAVSFEIGITRWLALQPEATYLQKAGKMRLANDGNVSLNVKMDYLEMPVLAKFRFGSNRLTGYTALGPSIGYAITGSTTFKADDTEISEKIRFDDSYDVDNQRDNRFDIGAVLAFGMQYKLGIGSIVLDARAALDVNDYAKPSGSRASYGLDTNHWEGIAMSLGYQIPLGRR